MNVYKKRGMLFCLAAAAGIIFTVMNMSSETVWAAAGKEAGYGQEQEEKAQNGQKTDDGSDRRTGRRMTFHPGSILLKQELKEEDLQSLKQPEASYTDEMGVQYHLADWEVRELPGISQSRMMEKREMYQEVEGAEALPSYIDSHQEKDGECISGRLHMQESRILGEEWRADFQAPVTFYSYGADEYELGGIRISGEDILAAAQEKQELLLQEMGLSPEAYHITSMDWEGESFMDETGQVCRMASARGERLLRDYEAVYRGEVQITEPVSYEVSAVYEPDALEHIPGRGEAREEVPVPEAAAAEEGDPFSRWIRTGVTVTAALGISGIFLGIFLYFSGKRRQKKQEEELEYH